MTKMQSIFSSIFTAQNRLQTVGEKMQDGITMKQWLLMAMTGACPEPRTLTNVGAFMGCSRQNTKKLAIALVDKGYMRLIPGPKNSLHIQLTDKAAEYARAMGNKHAAFFRLLFEDFTPEEMQQLHLLYEKLFAGIERVEKYAGDA